MDEAKARLIADKIIEMRAHMACLYKAYQCHPAGVKAPALYDQWKRIWLRYCWLLVAMEFMSIELDEAIDKVKLLKGLNSKCKSMVYKLKGVADERFLPASYKRFDYHMNAIHELCDEVEGLIKGEQWACFHILDKYKATGFNLIGWPKPPGA